MPIRTRLTKNTAMKMMIGTRLTTNPTMKMMIKTSPSPTKEIMDYCDGWLLLFDCYDDEYSIFNPITSQSVQFPALNLKPEQAIGFSILSSSPANPNSMLILFEKNATSFIFCRIGDNQWTEEPAKGEVDYKDDDEDYLISPVRCKGKLYCRTHNSDKIVEIGLIMQYQFIINLLPVKLPQYFEGYNLDRCSRMTEYSGQLVMIYMGLRWIPTEVHLEPNAVEVYRLDFSRMEWEILDSAKDAALFFSDRSRFSCAAVGAVSTQEAGYIAINAQQDSQVNWEKGTMISSNEDTKETTHEGGLDLWEHEKTANQSYSYLDNDNYDGSQQSSGHLDHHQRSNFVDHTQFSQKDLGTALDKEFREEKIWQQMNAIRKIVGYRGSPEQTCIEELKALYLFTGLRDKVQSVNYEPLLPKQFHDGVVCFSSLSNVTGTTCFPLHRRGD
ncbi:hypothetical protein SLEP1_g54321 [Rubroshorea leprosula]|uniref:KIB1-4 beta-propeller domain-containing protein n=1 Tax=Rubroshorea leprosula TaxID=152421 RepID=A0AAV5MD49_9ROSI|nr:hypothetical protein SLEP1_g54321 [Rubroshorea leprosula]